MIIDAILQEKIINYWKIATNNTIPDLMKKFKISRKTAHSVVNNYINSLTIKK